MKFELRFDQEVEFEDEDGESRTLRFKETVLAEPRYAKASQEEIKNAVREAFKEARDSFGNQLEENGASRRQAQKLKDRLDLPEVILEDSNVESWLGDLAGITNSNEQETTVNETLEEEGNSSDDIPF